MASVTPMAERERLHREPLPTCPFCGSLPESVYLKGVRCVQDKTCPIHKRPFSYAAWARRGKVQT